MYASVLYARSNATLFSKCSKGENSLFLEICGEQLLGRECPALCGSSEGAEGTAEHGRWSWTWW